jgi:Phosphate acetyl/butaryl transferase
LRSLGSRAPARRGKIVSGEGKADEAPVLSPNYRFSPIARSPSFAGATVIGPLIVGLEKPVQIVSLNAKDSDIVNMAALASFNIGG